MTPSEHEKLIGLHRRLLAWLRRLQLILSVALICYQVGMGVATMVAPDRVFDPDVWVTLHGWISIRVGGATLVGLAVTAAVSIARQSRRTLDFTITAQSLIWGSWSTSLIWDAVSGRNWSVSGVFGYGLMAIVGLFVLSPLTVGPVPVASDG